MPQTHMSFYSQFINLALDCPLVYQHQQGMPQTYLSMSVRDQEDPSKVLGVVQLLCRASNIRFTEQDVEHLALLTQHLS